MYKIDEIKKFFLRSLSTIGINHKEHDIRFIEDDWESPTLGAAGRGWEVWCDGMEITQFTYFQQMAGIECKPVSVELTYGLERICMFTQGKKNVFELIWNNDGIKYRDVINQADKEYSAYNFEFANTEYLLNLEMNRYIILAIVMAMIFLLGWPLEWVPIVMIIIPIILPLIEALNFNLTWFAILVAVNLQTAWLSPPVALSAYFLKGVVPEWDLKDIYLGMMQFMVLQVIGLIIIIIFPQIVLWLPMVLYGQ